LDRERLNRDVPLIGSIKTLFGRYVVAQRQRCFRRRISLNMFHAR